MVSKKYLVGVHILINTHNGGKLSLTTLSDGTIRFDYVLDFHPCSECGCCSITLFEQGGHIHPREHKKGKTKGGGFCNNCQKRVEKEGIEAVPSMTVLLLIWNAANPRTI